MTTPMREGLEFGAHVVVHHPGKVLAGLATLAAFTTGMVHHIIVLHDPTTSAETAKELPYTIAEEATAVLTGLAIIRTALIHAHREWKEARGTAGAGGVQHDADDTAGTHKAVATAVTGQLKKIDDLAAAIERDRSTLEEVLVIPAVPTAADAHRSGASTAAAAKVKVSSSSSSSGSAEDSGHSTSAPAATPAATPAAPAPTPATPAATPAAPAAKVRVSASSASGGQGSTGESGPSGSDSHSTRSATPAPAPATPAAPAAKVKVSSSSGSGGQGSTEESGASGSDSHSTRSATPPPAPAPPATPAAATVAGKGSSSRSEGK
jgi:hypothetical protein